MTKGEIKNIIELFISWNGEDSPIDAANLDSAIEYINECVKPSFPSNLDEAAEDFVWEVMENDEDGISDLSKKLRPTSKINDFYDALAEFFKAGAEWMERQGVSYQATISANKTIPVLPMKDVSDIELDYGDEVIVQIRKKK